MAIKELTVYKCDQCGKEIVGQKAYDIIKSIRCRKKCKYGFCSKVCFGEYRSSLKKIQPEIRACFLCGNDFLYQHGREKFCSSSCSAKHSNKKRLTKCEKCLKSEDRFCSDKCRNDFIENKIKYQQYREMCKFNFNFGDYPNEFDFILLDKCGMYSYNNLDGVGRDHIISVRFGFENRIDPEIIKHPANCQLMIQKKNSSKGRGCDIAIGQLVKKIEIWDKKYLTEELISV